MNLDYQLVAAAIVNGNPVTPTFGFIRGFQPTIIRTGPGAYVLTLDEAVPLTSLVSVASLGAAPSDGRTVVATMLTGTTVALNMGQAPANVTPQQGIATLVAGSVSVPNVAITGGASRIQITHNTPGGVLGSLSSPNATRVAGSAGSFVINSSSALDTSSVDWLITGTGSDQLVVPGTDAGACQIMIYQLPPA